MIAFRILLAVMIVEIVIYTGFVGMEHGWNLIPIFFNDILAMTWPGQFNLDFMGFLTLSGIWTMWRNQFSAKGLMLSLFAFFGGIMFLAPYLLFLTVQTNGDMKKVLLGDARAAA